MSVCVSPHIFLLRRRPIFCWKSSSCLCHTAPHVVGPSCWEDDDLLGCLRFASPLCHGRCQFRRPVLFRSTLSSISWFWACVAVKGHWHKNGKPQKIQTYWAECAGSPKGVIWGRLTGSNSVSCLSFHQQTGMDEF